jgi:hypothetical protein
MARGAGIRVGLELKSLPLPAATVIEPDDTRTAECPSCQGPRHPRAQRCFQCAFKSDWARHEQIAALWNTGMTEEQVAQAMHMSVPALEQALVRMRARGLYVPYRRKR